MKNQISTVKMSSLVRFFLMLTFLSASTTTSFAQVLGCNAHYYYQAVGLAQDSIHFTAPVNAPGATYTWDFGDGGNSTVPNPTHHYAHPGAYFTCLTVSVVVAPPGTPCINTWCDSVHVYPLHYNCDAHFNHANNSSGDSVRFSSMPNSPHANYLWDFGDGGSSTQPNPVHGYAPGAYFACLTITLLDSAGALVCTDHHCDSVHATVPHYNCDAHFTVHSGPSPSTLSDSVYFSGAQNPGGTSYVWDFGDGTTGYHQYTTHHYAPGAYLVCLTVTQTSAAGTVLCTATRCDSIHVVAPHVYCNAHYNWHQIQHNDSVRFNAPQNVPGTTYSWDFGDGGTSSQPSVTYAYLHPGTYYVCLTVTALSASSGALLCTDTYCDSLRIGIPPPPLPCNAHFRNFTGFGQNTAFFMAAMNQPGSTYDWDFGDGTTATNGLSIHQYPAPGAYYVCLTVAQHDSAGNVICTDTWCDSVHAGWRPHPTRGPWLHPFMMIENEGSTPEANDKMAADLNEDAGPVVAEIYPNPVTESTVLSLQHTNNEVALHIYDSTGRLVLAKENLGDGSIPLNIHLGSGLYFFRISNSGSMINSGKLVVE